MPISTAPDSGRHPVLRHWLATTILAALAVVAGACSPASRDSASRDFASRESALRDSASRDSAPYTARVDTVVRVDTIVRVDTVYRDGVLRAEPIDPGMSRSNLPPSGSPAPDTIAPTVTASDLTYLRRRFLLIPVPGVRASQLVNTYDEARASGARRHDAIDILAPRGTPVLSVDAGRIAAIDTSERGGLSLYATDPSERFMYYYAHLDRYAAGLRVGKPLARGDTLGTVGTTGNAPVNTPHLHFAIMRLGDPRRWWDGTAINPYPLLGGGR